MSELINNREYRQEMMKEVIKELHDGKTVEEVQEKYAKAIEGVSAYEITVMETELVKEGLPIEEIQRLCNVHAAVFKGSIEEIHYPEEIPGHPIYTMKEENVAIEEYIDNKLSSSLEDFKRDDSIENINKLIGDLNLLWDIDKHYSRKENLIFPYLEKYGITAPPQVMWGVHDEIRAMLKDSKAILMDYKGKKEELLEKIDEFIFEAKEMVYKEEKILFPMALERMTEDEWITVYRESDEIGYAIIEPEDEWELKRIKDYKEEEEKIAGDGHIRFETGFLTAEEISQIFNTLPGDITFIDKDDIVRYYSQEDKRIFARTKSVIGRSVQNCHPPASVHIVDQILEDFKSGEKDTEDFWIKMGDQFVLIRYFAIRSKDGEYLGTMEFSQNIAPIQEIRGEKRLLSQ